MQTVSFHFFGNEYAPESSWCMELDGKPDFRFFFGSGEILDNFSKEFLVQYLPSIFSIVGKEFTINARAAWKEIYNKPCNSSLQNLANSWGVRIVVKHSISSRVTPRILGEQISIFHH